MKVKFTKMHGLGNDFILVNLFDQPDLDYHEVAQAWCDRNVGIGADGLILIQPAGEAENQLRMTIYNSDGSVAAMCGNGIRCFAKYAYEQGLVAQTKFRVETLAGVMVPELQLEDGRVVGVCVDMGMPRFKPEEIPVRLEGEEIIDEEARFGDAVYEITAVSMGNPHCIIFVEDVERFPVKKIGSMISTDPLFPDGVNAEFVQVLNDQEVKMRVWERGAGLTLACGTGACATGVACVRNGKTDRTITVHLPGGDLFIEWAKDQRVYMTGPATYVYTGEIDYPNP